MGGSRPPVLPLDEGRVPSINQRFRPRFVLDLPRMKNATHIAPEPQNPVALTDALHWFWIKDSDLGLMVQSHPSYPLDESRKFVSASEELNLASPPYQSDALPPGPEADARWSAIPGDHPAERTHFRIARRMMNPSDFFLLLVWPSDWVTGGGRTHARSFTGSGPAVRRQSPCSCGPWQIRTATLSVQTTDAPITPKGP